MEQAIRILHLEDDPLDSEVVTSLLRSDGLPVELDRVETLRDFLQRLEGECYDLILSDYTVPGMDTFESFALARQRCPEVPFIFLSGTIGEEAAIEALKMGANDYVLKQKMERLAQTVLRALREAQEQKRRKQAEAALRESELRLKESEERFREAFAHAPVGMAITDLQGHFLEVNEAYCRMLGYAEQELLRPGVSFKDLTHADDLQQNLEEWRRLLAGEIPAFFFEKRYWRKDRRFIWVRASVTVRRNHQGEPFQIVAIIENIDDRKRAEEALQAAKEAAEEANRAKSDFLATMSHELRTPMTVILGYLELLLENQPSEEQRLMLQTVESAAGRLLAIIDDILDISRIEARRLKIEERPFDPRDRVAQVVELFSVQAREKGLALSWAVDAQVPRALWGDPDRIGQVLLNLVSNAVKFTPQGQVAVRVDRQADSVVFSVRDTGIGIPTEQLEHIFHPFIQVDSSLTRRFGGTGLGLAICRELVMLMGGQIQAESAPGNGSTFSFSLPLRPAAHELPPEEDLPVIDQSAPTQARILLVEDEVSVRDVLSMLLEKRGWQAEVAETGREAVAKWQPGKYDLVLMDVQMPVMDGLEATGRIRDLEEGSGEHTCILGLTAHAGRGAKEQCLAAGMDDYLAKPVRMHELFSKVEQCLDR